MGSVVISLDGELGWGRSQTEPDAEFVRGARENWYALLELFDEFEVPATWAVVGHLLLRSCEQRHVGHPGGERCCKRVCDGLPPEEVWFGPGLLEAVLNADVDHEIASHGFTHWRFDHGAMTTDVAIREYQECVIAAEDWGLDVSTFVFPVNQVGYRAELRMHGFNCYRGPNPHQDVQTPFEQHVRKLRDAFGRASTPPVVEPTIDEYGLVNVPASLSLSGPGGTASTVVESVRRDSVLAMAKRGIDAAADSERGVFHMWLHPHDLGDERDVERIRSVLSYLDERREASTLQVDTMADVAARIQQEQTGGGPGPWPETRLY